MNVVKIIDVLQNKINSATTAEQVFFLSMCIQNLNLGHIKTVSTYNDLLSLNPLSNVILEGQMYFVESEERLYYWFNDYWVSVLDQAVAITYSWGNAVNGMLGDNTTLSKSSPVLVAGGFTDWVQMSAGYNLSLGVRENGTLWAWGYNNVGQLGDGTTVNKSSPVSVLSRFTDWTKVSAGSNHGVGLRSNGTIWSWGEGGSGLLGDNTTVSKSSPVSVVGGFTDWVQISAGSQHTLALRSNGVIYAWGIGTNGRLGNNSTSNRSSPVSVVGGITDWKHIGTGNNHSMAIRATGQLYAWGSNSQGQLGINLSAIDSSSSPVLVVGGFTDWIQVDGGFDHSLGVRANGTAYAWGSNFAGKLGNNTAITASVSSPVLVTGGFTDWIQVACGSDHSVGIRATGQLYAWGTNTDGRLGDNTTISKSSPVLVVGGFRDWISVDASRHNLAIRIN